MSLPIFRWGFGMVLGLLGLTTVWSCRPNSAATSGGAAAFMRHPLWVTTSFAQALAAGSDSLYTSNCMTIGFEPGMDSLWLDICHQERVQCAYQVRDAKTLEIVSGLGEGPILLRLEQSKRLVLTGGSFEETIFEPLPYRTKRWSDPIAGWVAARLAGTYLPIDSLGQLDPANPIQLDSVGTTKGLEDLTRFEVWVGGDRQAGPFNLIYFQNPNQQERAYAWRLHRDTFLLAPAVLTSAPDEKPSYELGYPWQPFLLQPR